jgi:hypothetical protein
MINPKHWTPQRRVLDTDAKMSQVLKRGARYRVAVSS